MGTAASFPPATRQPCSTDYAKSDSYFTVVRSLTAACGDGSSRSVKLRSRKAQILHLRSIYASSLELDLPSGYTRVFACSHMSLAFLGAAGVGLLAPRTAVQCCFNAYGGGL